MTSQIARQLQALPGKGQTARDLVLRRVDLRGVRLDALRADGLDLQEADLRQSSLRAVKWRGCTLRDARLEASVWTDAVLRLCDLDGARASGACLVGARIENCTARGACFDSADLSQAVLTDTDFSRASLRGANLKDVEASGANLRGADLRGASLAKATFVNADLRGADLTDADLAGTDFRGADLRGVVGCNPAGPTEAEATGELPLELKALAETVTPLVAEILQTAGRGTIDAGTMSRLNEQVAALQRQTSPGNVPDTVALKAVARALDELGDDVVPKLLAALGESRQESPPPEVITLIQRLCRELALKETATAEDVLQRLMRGS
jgi:uncharacterized protein YjbI with pentapeptide repeats